MLAETTRARLLYETQVPTRFYLPREDVRVALEPSDAAHLLPVQGRGVLLVVRRRGRRARTSPGATSTRCRTRVAITGLVAFWDERVDVFVDGVPRPRPGGAVSDAMQDEFGA